MARSFHALVLVLLLGVIACGGSDSTASDSVEDAAVSQTVSVAVSGLSGHVGGDLAGVLYEEDQLIDLDPEPVGGFWSVVATDDFATTEVVRDLGPLREGRFPFVTDEVLVVEPGTYTLVLWVDDALSPALGRVPVNTDGHGLFGCHVIVEVDHQTQTEVVVAANVLPDGWNTNCSTGEAIPGTDASSQVNPREGLTGEPLEVPITVQVSADGTVYASFDDDQWQETIAEALRDSRSLAVMGSILSVEQLDDREPWALSHVLGEAWLVGGGDGDGGDFMSGPGQRFAPSDDPATFEPGRYRLFFEAWVPSGPMLFGCEADLDMREGPESSLTVPRLPSYSGGGIHWTDYADLQFPDCLP